MHIGVAIERFHLFMHLINVWQKRVAWRVIRVVRNVPNDLQLSFKDKKCYIANLSLMGEIDPREDFPKILCGFHPALKPKRF